MIEGFHLVIRGGQPERTVTVAGASPDVGELRLSGSVADAADGDTLRADVVVDTGDARRLGLEPEGDLERITAGSEDTGWAVTNRSSSVVDGDDATEMCAGTLVGGPGEFSLFGVCAQGEMMAALLAGVAACHLLEAPVAGWRSLVLAAVEADTAACRGSGWEPEPAVEMRLGLAAASATLEVRASATARCSHPDRGLTHAHEPRAL